MEEGKIKKVGMIACIMGLVFLMFITIGYTSLDGVVSSATPMESVYANAGITEEMLSSLENGGAIELDLAQINMLIGGIQSASRWLDILFVAQILWGASLFLALGVFLVNLTDNNLKKQLATLIFVENVLAIFPIVASFWGSATFSAFVAKALLAIAVIAAMAIIYAIVIVARHTEK